MTTFNPNMFGLLSATPILFDRIVVIDGKNFWEGVAKTFVDRFGERWKRTPKKGVWYLASNGVQFTIVRRGDNRGWDLAFYPYESEAAFKAAFEEGTHVGNAVYFETENEITAPAVISFLKQRGIL